MFKYIWKLSNTVIINSVGAFCTLHTVKLFSFFFFLALTSLAIYLKKIQSGKIDHVIFQHLNMVG